jgi:Na+(H+)/acetate symporter ActP
VKPQTQKRTNSLASTYLLTRISVVHHAALNCTRRIFAIACTSILFRIPITATGALGIAISFLAFMVFTYAKTNKEQQKQRQQQSGPPYSSSSAEAAPAC